VPDAGDGPGAQVGGAAGAVAQRPALRQRRELERPDQHAAELRRRGGNVNTWGRLPRSWLCGDGGGVVRGRGDKLAASATKASQS
jgi:hypothetical protein